MNLTEASTLSQIERAVNRVPTHEEAMEYPVYQMGFALHNTVVGLWRNNAVLNQLNRPAPRCLNSKDEGGAWNFSWKCPEDELFNEPDDRASMFYTVYPDGSVLCREFPDDELHLNDLLALLNLAAVIVSDCSEIPLENLRMQETADAYLIELKQLKQQWEAHK